MASHDPTPQEAGTTPTLQTTQPLLLNNDDLENLSPNSLAHLNQLSGIHDLVEEPTTVLHKTAFESQMQQLNIDDPTFAQNGIDRQGQAFTGFEQHADAVQQNNKRFFKNSRYSADDFLDSGNDAGSNNATHSQMSEFSTPNINDMSIHSIFSNNDNALLNNEYHEQIDKYGYIFRSPEANRHKDTSNTSAIITSSGHKPHHQTGNGALSSNNQRASSFDKINSQDNYYAGGYYYMGEEFETHSQASSGAFSDGDMNQQYGYTTPIQYMHGGGQNYYGAPVGFTPTIQFSSSQQKYTHPSAQAFYQEDSSTQNNSYHGDIQLTGQDVSLLRHQVTPKRTSSSDVKNPSGIEVQRGTEPNYQTPSPYRNNSESIFNPGGPSMKPQDTSQPFYPMNRQQNPAMLYQPDPRQAASGMIFVQQKQPMPGSANHFMRAQNQYEMNSNFQPGGMTYDNIGMQAPPMINRGFDFQMGNDPMLPLQHYAAMGPTMMMVNNPQLQQQPNFKSFAPGPLRTGPSVKAPSSQEREPNGNQQISFQPGNAANISKTVDNTPTSHQDPNQSTSSVGSGQNCFTGLIMDHNETFLYQVIKQYEDCQVPGQKQDILKGSVLKLALTQTGSRFLQKQLTKANYNIVSFFLDEIGTSLSELMVDNYGNYFCQRLLSSCSGDQRLSILRAIQSNFIQICCNKKGTHTIQTMFDLVNLPEEEIFIRNSLIGNVFFLSKDLQGTHVVQKVISSFEEYKREFIFEEILEKFFDLAVNSNGLCVVKKLVQHTSNPDHRQKLMAKLSENVIELVQNPYGNYAVTEVLNNWEAECCVPIFNQLKNKISQLSIQKFSSNVIERCLEKADFETRSCYINEICHNERLASLIRNSYGNYVVQKALKIAEGADKKEIILAIERNTPQIPDKKIRLKWEKIIIEAAQESNVELQNLQNIGSGSKTSSRKSDDPQ